jgi:glycine C-acetyltransferase/8-amino-7-oxononanoate synthase
VTDLISSVQAANGAADHDFSVFAHSIASFQRPRGKTLDDRAGGFYQWQDSRRRQGIWFYSRSLNREPGPATDILSDSGQRYAGINFASQDYLGLAGHPAVAEAAVDALRCFGPHSAGSPTLLGNTALSLQLEQELAETLRMSEVALFPTGWGAGFGAIAALVRPYDHVVMDRLAHACLQQGAAAATKNVHRTEHLSVDAIREQLGRIRQEDDHNLILVITEGLFSMDADMPDIAAIQAACREFDAVLLVDVAHDFGSMGPGGTGALGLQDMLGQVDLVMGSFSKTFASNGGFVAAHSPAVKQYLKFYGGPHIFSNALSPVQCAVVSAALRIVRSSEGDALRQQLMQVSRSLRGALHDQGITCLGMPSPINPVVIGEERVAAVAAKMISERGVLANLVEYPAVPLGKARFRMQAMATHTNQQAQQAAGIVADAVHFATTLFGNGAYPDAANGRQVDLSPQAA